MWIPLYRNSLNRKTYYASRICSVTGLLFILVSLVILILPLVLAYVTRGFYVKQKTLQTQPFVQFKRQLYIELAGLNVSSGLPISLKFSTTPLVSSESLRTPVIKTRETDVNNDGVYDQMETTVTFPLLSFEQVNSVKVAFLFDYKIITGKGDAELSFTMNPVVGLVQEQSVLPGGTLLTVGDLRMKQREVHLLSERNLASSFDVSLNDTFSWSNMLKDYLAQNEFVLYEQIPTWTFQTTPGSSTGTTFTLTSVINYSEDIVYYIPSVTELVKWIWIQYFSFFVPLAVLIYPLTIGYMVQTRVLPTTTRIENVKHDQFKQYSF